MGQGVFIGPKVVWKERHLPQVSMLEILVPKSVWTHNFGPQTSIRSSAVTYYPVRSIGTWS
jgi:hypothetical protein